MKAIWKLCRFGCVLAIINLGISALWVAIAFDNPWHQGLLMMIDFPASYFPFWVGDISHWFSDSPVAGNVAVDIAFLIIGPIWYFVVGLLASRLISSVGRLFQHRDKSA